MSKASERLQAAMQVMGTVEAEPEVEAEPTALQEWLEAIEESVETPAQAWTALVASWPELDGDETIELARAMIAKLHPEIIQGGDDETEPESPSGAVRMGDLIGTPEVVPLSARAQAAQQKLEDARAAAMQLMGTVEVQPRKRGAPRKASGHNLPDAVKWKRDAAGRQVPPGTGDDE